MDEILSLVSKMIGNRHVVANKVSDNQFEIHSTDRRGVYTLVEEIKTVFSKTLAEVTVNDGFTQATFTLM